MTALRLIRSHERQLGKSIFKIKGKPLSEGERDRQKEHRRRRDHHEPEIKRVAAARSPTARGVSQCEIKKSPVCGRAGVGEEHRGVRRWSIKALNRNWPHMHAREMFTRRRCRRWLARAFIQMEPRKESIDREASVEKAAARLRIALVCACKQQRASKQ